ncbi:MAG TPA: DUF349 domain-containing protein [Cyclobacteriaceae bacterium]
MEPEKIPYGYIKDGQIYLSATQRFQARLIGEVKDENTQASVEYFINRFKKLSDKINDLEELINNTENKGSFLMKLLHLKNSLYTYEALGDYEPLFIRLEDLQDYLEDIISKNRIRNTEIKQSLLAELEEIAKTVINWNEATEKVLDVKGRWIKTGNAEKEHQEQLEYKFNELLTSFFDRKRSFVEDKKRLINNRVKEYYGIINKLKEINRSRNLFSHYNEVKKLQEEWNQLGQIPNMKLRPLLQQFKYQTTQYFRNYKRQSGSYNSEDPHKNLELKYKLIEEVENIEKNNDRVDERDIKELQNKWKAVGRIPKENYKDINDKFFLLTTKLYEKNYLEKTVRARDKNYDEKNNREKIRIKLNVIKELLNRDEKELQSYRENSENFNVSSGDFDKMLRQKLNLQKRKVIVKRQIMRDLKSSLNQGF